jgi:nucleoside-diphosphate-sugar epimerase
MRVLVTGHEGYIGRALVPIFHAAGHEVVGLDTDLFAGCDLGEAASSVPQISADIRDVSPDQLRGFDAVVHLAGISNDPLGDLNAQTTYDINHLGTVHLARQAKAAGVPRFLFSSSCSLYGAHGNDYIDESADWYPVTPYGKSKVLAEQDLKQLADDDFSPVYLRNSTAYGMSSRLRGDLVVNNMTGFAYATGQVYMKSDGTPWRPLVHIQDISRAFLVALEAPRELVHNEAFNVGSTDENYQIRDVAKIVEETVPGSKITFAETAGPDKRNYRVNCEKIASRLGYRTEWTVRRGVQELYDAFRAQDLKLIDLEGARYMRIRRIQELQGEGRVDGELRWLAVEAAEARG